MMQGAKAISKLACLLWELRPNEVPKHGLSCRGKVEEGKLLRLGG